MSRWSWSHRHKQQWEVDAQPYDLLLVDEQGQPTERPQLICIIDPTTRLLLGCTIVPISPHHSIWLRLRQWLALPRTWPARLKASLVDRPPPAL